MRLLAASHKSPRAVGALTLVRVGRILQMWWRAKCEGVFWPPPLSERLYEGMVIDMLEAKRLMQRHMWAHDLADIRDSSAPGARGRQPRAGFGRSFSNGFGRTLSNGSRASRSSRLFATHTYSGASSPLLAPRSKDPAAICGYSKAEATAKRPSPDGSAEHGAANGSHGLPGHGDGAAHEYDLGKSVADAGPRLAQLAAHAERQSQVLDNLVLSSGAMSAGIHKLAQQLEEQALKIDCITRAILPQNAGEGAGTANAHKNPIYLSSARSPVLRPRLPSDLVVVGAASKGKASSDKHAGLIWPRGKQGTLSPRSACSVVSIASSWAASQEILPSLGPPGDSARRGGIPENDATLDVASIATDSFRRYSVQHAAGSKQQSDEQAARLDAKPATPGRDKAMEQLGSRQHEERFVARDSDDGGHSQHAAGRDAAWSAAADDDDAASLESWISRRDPGASLPSRTTSDNPLFAATSHTWSGVGEGSWHPEQASWWISGEKTVDDVVHLLTHVCSPTCALPKACSAPSTLHCHLSRTSRPASAVCLCVCGSCKNCIKYMHWAVRLRGGSALCARQQD